jgi:hypothetical protein
MKERNLEIINSIHGWCIPEVWNCIQPISIYQRTHAIQGPIAEIGVFKGKFFCGLALISGKVQAHCAIDVFDKQQFNLDNSGIGNLELFKRNLRRFDINNTEIHKLDSLSVDSKFVNERGHKYCFFSVDGCHTIEHTMNDFQLAMKMVKQEGIIFIDDYYNPLWPGVHEGISKYYLNHSSNYIPLLFTCNKLFICSISYHQEYFECIRDFLRKYYPQSRVKVVHQFGYKSLTVLPKWSLKKYWIDDL